MEDSDLQENLGIDRRTLLKRSAVVGGTLVWAAPLVQTLAKPAFAASATCGPIVLPPLQCVPVGPSFHLTCGFDPGQENCPCVCGGFAPPSSCPNANPCTLTFGCTGLLAGPC